MRNILVTGASGVIGFGILRSLRKANRDWRLIGTSIYNDSVAPAFCDIFELAPPTNDAHYIDWLVSTINKNEVDLIIPGIEVDVHRWAGATSILEKSGVRILLNCGELIKLCSDKWNFYESLRKVALAYAIDTSLESDFDVLSGRFGLPFLIKPRRGEGSKGLVLIDSPDTFSRFQSDLGALLMAQPIVGREDKEFTTSAFCDGCGGFYASMTLKRKLSKDGFTEKAEVSEAQGVDDVLQKLCKHYKPIGPTNFQFREHEGKLKLLEINPRISSATSIRTAFGYNESVMAVDYFLEDIIPKQPIIRQGRAVRYLEDFIFYA